MARRPRRVRRKAPRGLGPPLWVRVALGASARSPQRDPCGWRRGSLGVGSPAQRGFRALAWRGARTCVVLRCKGLYWAVVWRWVRMSEQILALPCLFVHVVLRRCGHGCGLRWAVCTLFVGCGRQRHGSVTTPHGSAVSRSFSVLAFGFTHFRIMVGRPPHAPALSAHHHRADRRVADAL